MRPRRRSSITGTLIALGTPRELIASLGAEHVVEFALAEGTACRRAERCARCLACATCGSAATTVALATSRPALHALPALLAQLSGANLTLTPAHARTARRSRTSSSRSPDGSCGMVDRGGASHPLVELTLARFREFLREPEAVFWVFAFPVLLACALGLAFRNQRGAEPVIVGVRASGSARRPICVHGARRRPAGVTVRAVDRGGGRRRRCATARSPAGRRAGLAADVSTSIRGAPESRVARLVVDDALQRAAGRAIGVAAADRASSRRVPGSRYIDWVVPGLLGMNIMGTGMWSVGFSIVQARVAQAAEAAGRDADARRDYLLSHMARRLLFLVLEVGRAARRSRCSCSASGAAASWLLLAVLCLLGRARFAGLGLLVASRAQTIEGVSGLMNLVMVPMWVLSGVFFASSNFPEAMQPFIAVLPLTALNHALRGVMIDGSGLPALVSQIAILGAWGVVSFVLALRIFRWQ